MAVEADVEDDLHCMCVPALTTGQPRLESESLDRGFFWGELLVERASTRLPSTTRCRGVGRRRSQ